MESARDKNIAPSITLINPLPPEIHIHHSRRIEISITSHQTLEYTQNIIQTEINKGAGHYSQIAEFIERHILR